MARVARTPNNSDGPLNGVLPETPLLCWYQSICVVLLCWYQSICVVLLCWYQSMCVGGGVQDNVMIQEDIVSPLVPPSASPQPNNAGRLVGTQQTAPHHSQNPVTPGCWPAPHNLHGSTLIGSGAPCWPLPGPPPGSTMGASGAPCWHLPRPPPGNPLDPAVTVGPVQAPAAHAGVHPFGVNVPGWGSAEFDVAFSEQRTGNSWGVPEQSWGRKQVRWSRA